MQSYPDMSEPVAMTTSAIVECVSVEKLALQQEKAEDSKLNHYIYQVYQLLNKYESST